MAVTTDRHGTVRLREVFSTSFKTFRKHIVAFVSFSASAHLIFPALTYLVRSYFPDFHSLYWGDVYVVDFVCVIASYGAIIYLVVQDLAGRRVSMIRAVAVATRRSLLLVGVAAAVVALSNWTADLVLEGATTEANWRETAVISSLIEALIRLLVTTTYLMVAPGWVTEKASVGGALSRRRFLTRGYWWRIIVAVLLVGILEFAIYILWTVGAISLATLGRDVWGPEAMVLGGISFWSTQGFASIFGAFNAVIAAVAYDRLRQAGDSVHSITKVFD